MSEAATGEPRWVQRFGGNYSASPVAVAGRIYFVSEEGVTTVIAASPEFRVLARNAINGMMLASPAVARGSIVLRSDRHVYRIASGRARQLFPRLTAWERTPSSGLPLH